MGTNTATILVGRSHPNHGGIIPSAELILSENSRPAWTLSPRFEARLDAEEMAFPNFPKRVWIPSRPEHILEDGLLMLALYVWRNRELRCQARELFDLKEPRQDLTRVDAERLAALRDSARTCSWPGKLVLSVFRDSYLLNQLEKLEPWPIQAEVCTPQWWRIQSQWDEVPRTGGSLAIQTLDARRSLK